MSTEDSIVASWIRPWIAGVMEKVNVERLELRNDPLIECLAMGLPALEQKYGLHSLESEAVRSILAMIE